MTTPSAAGPEGFMRPRGFFRNARTGWPVPWQTWVVALLLGLEGVGNLLEIPAVPAAAWWLAFKVVTVVGLIRGWRWVYVVTIITGSLHVLAFAPINLITATLNLVLVVLVASTYRYFFPRRGDSVKIGESERPTRDREPGVLGEG